MEIDEEYIDKVKSLIEQKDAENVKTLLTDLHPADIAELCNDLGLEEARFVYRLLDNETAADVLVEMDEDIRKEFLELLPSETIAKRFVDYMDTDDAVDLMRELDEDKHALLHFRTELTDKSIALQAAAVTAAVQGNVAGDPGEVPQSPERDTLLEFIRTSKRGIIKPYESRCKG